MKRTFFQKLRTYLHVELDPHAPTGALDEAELETLGSLYGALCGDTSYDARNYLDDLSQRAQRVPGLLPHLRAAVALLQESSWRRHGKAFAALNDTARDDVLAQLLSGSSSRYVEPMWRRRAKLTRWHFDQLLCKPNIRAFREVVVNDILLDYFRGEQGWSLVGYDEFPGRVRTEWEPCEVVRVHFEPDHILLELSDGIFDKLGRNALKLDGESLSAVVKSGRQCVPFSKGAYDALTSRLEERDDEFVIRHAADEWRISVSD